MNESETLVTGSSGLFVVVYIALKKEEVEIIHRDNRSR